MVLFLVATVGQASHVCKVVVPIAGSTTQLYAPGTTVCLTCLMAQSAAVAFIFVVVSLSLRLSSTPPSLSTSPRSFLDSFHLYVRPPPA